LSQAPIAQLAPLSGSRTVPDLSRDLDAATTDVEISASAILHEEDVGSVLADLEQRSSVSVASKGSAAHTQVAQDRRGRAGSLLLAVLVLIAAGGAAAVVYFALPYLT
jgi:hypothetical protein